MDCERESKRPLQILIGAEALVALCFIAAAWTDHLTATAGKFVWTGVILLVFLAVAAITEYAVRRL